MQKNTNKKILPTTRLDSRRRPFVDARRFNHSLPTKKGYVTLISILVIGAVGLAVTSSLVLLGVGSSRNSLALEQGNQAKALANICAEEALQQIWQLDVFVGTGNITTSQGTCNYIVTNTAIPKTITVAGIVGMANKKNSITVDSLHPYVHISSWQEVAN